MFRLLLLPLIIAASLTSNLSAQFKGFGGGMKSVATLHSESKAIAPGATFSLALELQHPAEWHSYYKNSGGVELPPEIAWQLPEGFSAGQIQWPVPEVKDGYLGKSFVYPGSPVFIVDITAPAGLEVGKDVTLKADAKWQICKEACISESQSFTLTLPVNAVATADLEQAQFFARSRANQPQAIETLTAAASERGERIVLNIGPASAIQGTPTDFIPDQPFMKSASAGGEIVRDGDGWKITLERIREDAFENVIPQGSAVSGILTGEVAVKFPTTSFGAAGASQPGPASAGGLLKILGGMFIGGLILNLMPCVFPVIGLKIMGFVQQAGEDRKKIALHGVAFTVGVLASFGVLSGILFAARATTGWGFQLQNPWVVLVLMLLMFILALNMFGLFELGTSATSVGGNLQNKQGLSGSLFSGVLATVLATPCSGPFLGVALAAAIALPAVQFFAAFGAMAIGLALPYLVLSIFPKLIDRLPRPGPWMESFKQAMSFLLFGTAGYLLWIYAAQIELDNLLNTILGLCAIALAAWIYGRWNLPHKSGRTRGIALALTLLFAVGGFLLAKPPEKSALVWETWSQERVDELLEAGTPVYIDFTAKWCATCQVNKKVAYTDEVIALMKQKGVVALKADKTNPDPAIDEKIAQYGRAAIPVNVLLTPDAQPIVTPEVLTPGYLSELFGKIPAAD